MGCSGSKTKDSKVLMHCKERRERIEATVDGRFALASAQAAYSRALVGVGDAVYHFVQDEISVASSTPHLSPEGKSKSSKLGDRSLSPIDSIPLSVSEERGSHLHLSDESGSYRSPSENNEENGFLPISGGKSSNLYHMKKNSAAIPTVVRQTPPSKLDHLYVYTLNDENLDDNGKSSPKYSTTPPPPPASASWDFLYLFDEYDDNIYSGHRIGSVTSSINTAEVREKEGIPDLEDEFEDDATEETNKKKMTKVEGNECQSSRSRTSVTNAATIKSPLWQEIAEGHPLEEESVGSTTPRKAMIGDGGLRGSGLEGWVLSGRKEMAAFDGETSLLTEESLPSIGTALYREGTRDVRKVVTEIREDFKVAAGVGEELAEMLQVVKYRYRRRRNDSIPLRDSISTLAYLLPSFQCARRSLTGMLGMVKVELGNSRENAVDTKKTSDVPSAIDKLYAWEEKLFEEVEKEESLRVEYEKRFQHLQLLLENGAEPSKILSGERLMGEVLTGIDVSIRSIVSISRTIHKLRDEELQPHLVTLIEGFARMWSSLLECHRKQYQAVVNSKTGNLNLKAGSSAKATAELERRLLNWSACFGDLISTHMDYVEALNRWLVTTTMMFFNKKPPVFTAKEGVVLPFPPEKFGAPPALVTAHDWWHAMRMAPPGDEVATAMKASAANVRELLRTRRDECCEKQRLESLLRAYDRSRSDSAIRKPKGRVLLRSYVHPLEHVRGGGGGDGREEDDRAVPAVDLMRRRLQEAKWRHEEIVEQVRQETAGILRTTFVPILEAMGRFIFETLKAHEGVRISNVERRKPSR